MRFVSGSVIVIKKSLRVNFVVISEQIGFLFTGKTNIKYHISTRVYPVKSAVDAEEDDCVAVTG